MKAFYFERFAESDSHFHADSYCSGIYVPDENAILFREQQGSFTNAVYALTQRQEFLDEVKAAVYKRVL